MATGIKTFQEQLGRTTFAQIGKQSSPMKAPRQEESIRDLIWRAATKLQEGQTRQAVSFFAEAAKDAPLPPATDRTRELYAILVRGWGIAAAFYALTQGFVPGRLEPAEFGVRQFLAAVEFANRAGLEKVAVEVADFVTNGSIDDLSLRDLTGEEQQAFEDLKTAIQLLSMQDPFERWELLGEQIDKAWPESLSAAEAVREHRR